MSYKEIESITKIKSKRRTYDISVDNIHNFILSNGVVSHNSGKTVSVLSFSGLYHDNPNRRYKIIDLWGGSRNEQLYWGLPSNQKKYWDYAKKTLRLKTDGPKQYKVEYWFPMNKELLRKRKNMPFNPPHVTSKIITFDIRDLKAQDFQLVVGSLSEGSVGQWNDVIYESKKKDSSIKLVKEYAKRVTSSNTMYNSALNPMHKQMLLQDSLCEFNITTKMISKMLDDQETITVICLDYLNEEFKLFVIGYLLRKICSELDRKRRKTIGIFREVSEFFRVNDASIVPERVKVMKSYLTQWIQMGRRGLHLFLDVQSISDTKGIVSGQQDLTLYGRLPGEADRRAATEQLYRDDLVTKKQIKQLGVLNPGQFLFSPSGRHSSLNYVMLPRCRFWEERNGNFYNNVWEREVGRWINYNEEVEKLKEKLEKDKIDWEEANKKIPKARGRPKQIKPTRENLTKKDYSKLEIIKDIRKIPDKVIEEPIVESTVESNKILVENTNNIEESAKEVVKDEIIEEPVKEIIEEKKEVSIYDFM